jgi:RHS repeat-associated protein
MRRAGWVAAIVAFVIALIASSLHASTTSAGAASASPPDAAADDYHPRNVPFEPVSSKPPEQPRPTLPVGGIKSVSSDVTVNAKGGDVALDEVPASLRVAKGALPDDTHVHVEVLADTVGTKLSPVGMAFEVKFTAGKSRAQVVPDGKVLIDVDYAQLAGRFGGDFLDRLQVVEIPECRRAALAAGDQQAAVDPACPANQPLITQKNDKDGRKITIDLGPRGAESLDQVASSGGKDGVAFPAAAQGGSATDETTETPSKSTSMSTSTSTSSTTSSTAPPGADATPAADSAASSSSTSTSSTTSPTASSSSTTTSTTAPSEAAIGGALGSRSLGAASLGGGGGTFALTSGASGPNGDYSATPIAGVSSSEVGEQSGSAESEYPIKVPPPPAGAAPDVKLQYSSASVDGFTTDRNSQSSDVGIGWQLNTASITREFKSCNRWDAPGDLCWSTDNYRITLNGVSDALVPIQGTDEWRLAHDPYWRVQRVLLSEPAYAPYVGYDRSVRYPNGNHAFAYFIVTTPDGTKYRFGGEVDPESGVHTNSVFSVPVYHPGTGDPCHDLSYWMCLNAWRWNLDRVEDVSGNVQTYYYARGVNFYNVRSGGAPWQNYGYTPYGYLWKIAYTKVAGGSANDNHRQQVIFDYENRCTNANPSACTMAEYPDTPWDLLCYPPTMSTCGPASPSFWGGQRLKQITTQVSRDATTFPTVMQYQMKYSFPNPDPSPPNGVATPPKLQLDQISIAGTNVGQPTKFTYAYLYNRVNYPAGVSPMATARLSTVTNELGGQTVFGYGQPEPCAQNTVYNYSNHHLDCFPAFYGVGPSPGWIPFNKWVVTSEFEIDTATLQPVQATSYTYNGGPGWRYSMSPVLPDVGTTSNPQRAERNWNEFRGFAHVVATKTTDQALTTVSTRYFQGMDGDRANPNDTTTTKIVYLTLSDGTQVLDKNTNAGMEADRNVLSGGTPISRRQTTYYRTQHPTNGLAVDVDTYLWTPFQSWFVAPTDIRETASDVTPSPVTRTVYTSFDDYGHAQLEQHYGDTTLSSDDWHIDREFKAIDSTRWIHGLVTSEIVRTGLSGLTTVKQKTEWGYNDSTNPISNTHLRRFSTETHGDQTVMTYDTRGRLISSKDPNLNVTQYTYDQNFGAAKSLQVDAPLGVTTKTESDPDWGLPTKITDANGNSTHEDYDGVGRLTSVWLPTEPETGPATKQFSYLLWAPNAALTRVKTTQLQASGITFDSYLWTDGWGRTIQTATKSPTLLTSKAARVSTLYDGAGHVDRVSAPYETTGSADLAALATSTDWDNSIHSFHQYDYDALGRTTKDWLKDTTTTTTVTTTSYSGWSHTVNPPVGGNTTYKNDGNGNLMQVVEDNPSDSASSPYTTSYEYEVPGRLKTVTDADPAHNVSTTTYDLLGRKVASTDADAGSWLFAYDDADNLVSQTDARGIKVALKYDALNRLTEKHQNTDTGQLLAKYQYSTVAPDKGLLDWEASYDSSLNEYKKTYVSYDEANRPTTVQWSIPPVASTSGVSGTYRFDYRYDAAGHQTKVIYPGGPAGTTGENVDTTYNNLGYPNALTSSNGASYVDVSGYTATGALASQTLGGGVIGRSLTYDASTLRLTNMKAGAGVSATNRQNLTYAYDAVDNVKSIVDGNNSNQRQCFHYDDRNRLDHAYTGTGGTGGCSSVDNTTGTSPPPYNQTFTYSPSGNFLTAAGRSYGYGTTQLHAPKTVGSDSFAYNENGAEVGRTVGGVGALLGYDQLNHLTSVAQTSATSTYFYGSDDQRLIRKDGTTVTLYLEGNYQSQSVNGAAATVTKYYSLGAQRVAVRKGSTLYYELADQLGSAAVTTDSSGNNMTRQNYFPFGALRPGPGNNLPVDETYLGKTLDTATNLVQMGSRYYDPANGRFISTDPLADSGTPQSLNPYAYALNNPLTYSDPDGTFPCDNPRDRTHCHTAPATNSPSGSPPSQPNTNTDSGGHGGHKSHHKSAAGSNRKRTEPDPDDPLLGQDWSTYKACHPRGYNPNEAVCSWKFGYTYEHDGFGWDDAAALAVGICIAAEPCGVGAVVDFIATGGVQEIGEGASEAVPAMTVDSNQFGTKFGRHAAEWGFDASAGSAADRSAFMRILINLRTNYAEVRQGPWNPASGGGDDYLFFRKGSDVLITKGSGPFVTVLRDGADNAWFNAATPR